MKHFLTILNHEVRMLLMNPSTYIAAVLFLGVMGYAFTDIIDSYTKAPQEISPAYNFFQVFWLPVFFMCGLRTGRRGRKSHTSAQRFPPQTDRARRALRRVKSLIHRMCA